MSKKKHEYCISINSLSENFDEYIYKYGNVDNIKLKISESGVLVELLIGSAYTLNEIIGYGNIYIFPDSIKKALLLYLLKFNKSININNISVYIDGRENVVDIEVPIVKSMISGDLVRPLTSDEWKKTSVINMINSFTKTKYDGRMAALYSLLYSKSKTSEIERFVYLWMSFNGLYGYVSSLIASLQNKTRRISDGEGIGWIIALYDLGKNRVVEKDSKNIAKKVIGDLSDWDGVPITNDSLEKGVHTSIKRNIEKRLVKKDGTKIDISVYGYLLGFFSYYFRCNIIHANKPISLFYYEKEYEINCLRIINQMLENFLDLNLVYYFEPINEVTLNNRLLTILNDITQM